MYCSLIMQIMYTYSQNCHLKKAELRTQKNNNKQVFKLAIMNPCVIINSHSVLLSHQVLLLIPFLVFESFMIVYEPHLNFVGPTPSVLVVNDPHLFLIASSL